MARVSHKFLRTIRLSDKFEKDKKGYKMYTRKLEEVHQGRHQVEKILQSCITPVNKKQDNDSTSFEIEIATRSVVA